MISISRLYLFFKVCNKDDIKIDTLNVIKMKGILFPVQKKNHTHNKLSIISAYAEAYLLHGFNGAEDIK